jgi:hypothetical protein
MNGTVAKTIELFANTGIQYITLGPAVEESRSWGPVKLSNGRRPKWIKEKTYVLTKLGTQTEMSVVAVDTTTGPVSKGFFAESEDMINNPVASLTHGSEDFSFSILSSEEGMGKQLDCALILDLGNCRCMGLIADKIASDSELPLRQFEFFENDEAFYHANCLGEFEGHIPGHAPEASFNSRLELRTPEFSPMETSTPKVVGTEIKKVEKNTDSNAWTDLISGLFGIRKKVQYDDKVIEKTELVKETSHLFAYYSQVRLGDKNLLGHNAARNNPNLGAQSPIGMSSPKRYIWDGERLGDKKWHQLDPKADTSGYRPETVRGYYYRYQPENDYDWKSISELENDKISTEPISPAYPRRSMLTAVVYEIISKCHQLINSTYFRRKTLTPMQKRRLTDLVVTYPSGMHSEERDQYREQLLKALRIFKHTNLFNLDYEIQLHMNLDEGSAGQIAYAYGEAKMFNSANRWINSVGRGGRIRIANIDIGGGTTDLMIGDYFPRGKGTTLAMKYRTLHVDGISRGGDNFIQRLLESVIIPGICDNLKLAKADAIKIFKDKQDGGLRQKRNRWLNEILLPLAIEYLKRAQNGDSKTGNKISISEIKDFDAYWDNFLEDISTITALPKGNTKFQLKYDETKLTRAVEDTYGQILDHYNSVVSSSGADILLLSGKGSDLKALKKMIIERTSIPFTRVVFLGGYYTGEWCPFDSDSPGSIKDPKSVVSIGAALKYLSQEVGLAGSYISQEDSDETHSNPSYWGQVKQDVPNFLNEDALFTTDASRNAATDFFVGHRVFLGSRQTENETMEVYPTYVITIPREHLNGVEITFERTIEGNIDKLKIKSVLDANGQPVEQGVVKMRLRTMFDESFFLDEFLTLDESNIA